MDQVRILVVVGTRPEAIKMLPVIRALRDSARLAPVVVSTGQHRHLVESVFALAGVVPDIDLATDRVDDSLNHRFAAVLTGLERACQDRYGPPDAPNDRQLSGPGGYPAACVVHGDTSSAVAAALASFHLKIPVAHIEAGLRSDSTLSPFPEELNRQLITRIAAFHLAPTTLNKENLVREGVRAEQVFVTGNTGIDALRWASRLDRPYGVPALDRLDDGTRVVVATAHRRENWGHGLVAIAEALAELARANPRVLFVLPVHPNPLVGDALHPRLDHLDNVLLLPAMDYVPFAKLLGRAHLAISDSGGIQEEAPTLGTPVLVTRESTERREGLVAGTLRLVGTDPARIVAEAQRLLDDPEAHLAMATAENPYGDGRAAHRIVQAFEHLAFGGEPPVRFGAGYRRAMVLRAAGYEMDMLAATRTAPGRGHPPEHLAELPELVEA